MAQEKIIFPQGTQNIAKNMILWNKKEIKQ